MSTTPRFQFSAEWLKRTLSDGVDDAIACGGGVLPSCMNCGHVETPAKWLIDKPEIYICEKCANAAQELSAANERERINEESLCHRIAVAESSLSDALAKLAMAQSGLTQIHNELTSNSSGVAFHLFRALTQILNTTIAPTSEAAHAFIESKVREYIMQRDDV